MQPSFFPNSPVSPIIMPSIFIPNQPWNANSNVILPEFNGSLMVNSLSTVNSSFNNYFDRNYDQISTVSNSSLTNNCNNNIYQIVIIRMLMSGKEVGSIIGKRGDNVKKFREQSGARINISDGSCPERIVTVTGTVERVYGAFLMMCQKFEFDYKNDQQHNKLEDQTSEELINTIQCPPVTLRLLVPATQCGSIIGKGGCKIKDLRDASGASIQVASELLPQSSERTVTVSGSASAVANCIKQISQILLETPAKCNSLLYVPKPAYSPASSSINQHSMGYPQSPYIYPLRNQSDIGSNPSSANANNSTPYTSHFINHSTSHLPNSLYPINPSVIPANPMLTPNPIFQSNYFTGPTMNQNSLVVSTGDIFQQSQNLLNTNTHSYVNQQVASTSNLIGPVISMPTNTTNNNINPTPINTTINNTSQSNNSANYHINSNSIAHQLQISNEMIGCIIGRGGATINEIRALSGAQIKICGDGLEEGTSDRHVIISGTLDSINTAQLLINANLQSYKKSINHPTTITTTSTSSTITNSTTKHDTTTTTISPSQAIALSSSTHSQNHHSHPTKSSSSSTSSSYYKHKLKRSFFSPY